MCIIYHQTVKDLVRLSEALIKHLILSTFCKFTTVLMFVSSCVFSCFLLFVHLLFYVDFHVLIIKLCVGYFLAAWLSG